MGKRIILASLGSAGDLHPYVAIAQGLIARGHSAAVGTHADSRMAVEKAGVDFLPVRPDFNRSRASALMANDLFHPIWGHVRARREFLASIGATFEDLMQPVRGADLFISSPTVAPAGLVAAATAVPWIPAYHTCPLFSSIAESVAGNMFPGHGRWHRVHAMVRPLAARLLKPFVSLRTNPLDELAKNYGITYKPGEELRSRLVLGLLSPLFAPMQSNWPSQTRLTGFPIYDGTSSGGARQTELETFLGQGEPPLVFSLGATQTEQDFFSASMAAAVQLKRRALFVIGNHSRSVLPDKLPEGMLVTGQMPYSSVFPKASVIIHHGGVGTTALALRAGRPMLVVPRAFDQPGNATRAERLGVARVIPRSKYNAGRATEALRRLLKDTNYQMRAAELGPLIRAEDGVRNACDAIEEFLSK